MVGVWPDSDSYKITFLGGHFLFTCSDTFAVGRII